MKKDRAVLLDADGTIFDSQPAFTKWHDIARHYLAGLLDLEYARSDTIFGDLWKEGHSLYYVNPEKLIGHTCNSLSVAYRGLTDKNLGILRQMLWAVYDEPVYLYPEIEETIDGLIMEKMILGIVTHASSTWTDKKMKWTGIDEFLMKNRPYIVSINGPKDYTSWLLGARYYGVNKSNTWVVGDNLNADANAGSQAGFVRNYWLKRTNEKVWTVVRDGKVAEGVRTIELLSDLLSDT